jgi:hypothetical protein
METKAYTVTLLTNVGMRDVDVMATDAVSAGTRAKAFAQGFDGIFVRQITSVRFA